MTAYVARQKYKLQFKIKILSKKKKKYTQLNDPTQEISSSENIATVGF